MKESVIPGWERDDLKSGPGHEEKCPVQRNDVLCDSFTILETKSGYKMKYACAEANEEMRIPIFTSGGVR